MEKQGYFNYLSVSLIQHILCPPLEPSNEETRQTFFFFDEKYTPCLDSLKHFKIKSNKKSQGMKRFPNRIDEIT